MNAFRSTGLMPFLSVLTLATLAGLESCVGDDPATAASSANDGGNDDSTIGSSDASSDASSEASTNVDSGVDAAPPDPCKGEASGCPNLVNPTHLQLWLRADTQLDCVGGRVATWHDLSGHGRNATAAPYPDAGLALAPQCGVDTLKGHGVVSFTRPTEASTPILSETMVADMGFMANASFTAFMVVKPAFGNPTSYLGLLSSDRSSFGIAACPNPHVNLYNYGALDLGLSGQVDGGAVFTTYDLEATCPLYSEFPIFTSNTYVVQYTYDATKGHTVVVGGDLALVGDGGPADLQGVADLGMRPAAIGRESNGDFDKRFQGDIAEVVIYDVALGPEAGGITSYLNGRWH